jgi:hypothetical protein
MPMSNSQFRWLLVVYVIATLAAVASSFLPDGHSQVLADAYAQESESWFSSNIWVLMAIALPLLAAIVAGFVGLFLFKRWGRAVSFYSTLAGLCLYLFTGPTVNSALEGVLYEVSSLLWGAILALSYYSPIAGRLGANDSFKPKPHRGSA